MLNSPLQLAIVIVTMNFSQSRLVKNYEVANRLRSLSDSTKEPHRPSLVTVLLIIYLKSMLNF